MTVAGLDTDHVRTPLKARVNDTTALLERQTLQARQMLRRLHVGRISLEPFGSGHGRGYKFRGKLALDQFISGERGALGKNTPHYGGPKGKMPCRTRGAP